MRTKVASDGAARLILVGQGATAATRSAAFPVGDEPLLAKDIEVLPRLRASLGWWESAVAAPTRAARDTAAALAAGLVVEPALRDCAYGRWAGCTMSEIEAADPTTLARWLGDEAAAPPEGESLSVVLARVRGWLDACTSTPGIHLVIAPPFIVRALIVAALGLPAAAFWRLDAAPLGISRLTAQGCRWRLASLNAPS